jgi:hypothetical protein
MSETIAFSLPPLRFIGLELAVGAAFCLTLAHAVGRFRDHDRWPLVQWLTALFYGVIIELVAFNFWDNYNHGQFTVQLYHHKLPLYVTLLYPSFHYTGLKLVESWRLSRRAEPFLVGLCIMLVDVPFDVAGPDAGWWSWSTKDPNLAVRWLGVPITSYYWYLVFGAIYAALLRVLKPRLERRNFTLLLTPLFGAAVLVLGVIAFIPFHLIKALGVPDDAIVAVHIAGCALLAWTVRPVAADSPPQNVRISAALLHLLPWIVLCATWPTVSRAPTKLFVLFAASLALGRFLWPLRGRAAVARA